MDRLSGLGYAHIVAQQMIGRYHGIGINFGNDQNAIYVGGGAVGGGGFGGSVPDQ